ncbi:MAG: divalent metal cation transporter [Planctomycetaceae bacterium]|nr:divalent metal cation transporter [Planctomycetaceae bacterium]
MSAGEEKLNQERQLIDEARRRGPFALLKTYTRLSGPGWLQSAITLGGGSLGGSLYLGVLTGFSMLWLQPLAMILGVIMLSATAYVTLSTGERPFGAIRRHINPVLAWSWLIATMLANMVWCMPQFSLGVGAVTQNLFPGADKLPATVVLFAASFAVVWSYNTGSQGVRFFELLLKILVGIVVISFFGVVLRMAASPEGLPWSEILAGFNPSNLLELSPRLASAIDGTGPYADFWRGKVMDPQIKTLLTAAATAVGINMTFLLPYSLLKRGWDRTFRGLAIFDLSTGLVVPYMLATGCVVLAAASQFHAQPAPGFLGETAPDGTLIEPAANLAGGVYAFMDDRLKQELGPDEFHARFGASKAERSETQTAELSAARKALPEADIRMAAILAKRDNQQLAGALETLTGRTVAHYVFGIGVLAMAVSTIIILMLINGFALCEALGTEGSNTVFRIGCIIAGLSGAVGSQTLWSNKEAAAWLVVPTSMFGFALLPIAYITFFAMMNSREILGENMPRGLNRLKWNVLMSLSTGLALVGSFFSISNSDQPTLGFGLVGAIIAAALVAHILRRPGSSDTSASASSHQ